jgi:hypothetical protein
MLSTLLKKLRTHSNRKLHAKVVVLCLLVLLIAATDNIYIHFRKRAMETRAAKGVPITSTSYGHVYGIAVGSTETFAPSSTPNRRPFGIHHTSRLIRIHRTARSVLRILNNSHLVDEQDHKQGANYRVRRDRRNQYPALFNSIFAGRAGASGQ